MCSSDLSKATERACKKASATGAAAGIIPVYNQSSMDKVLAFSILSASPADVAPGAGASWARFSWQGRKLRDDEQARAGQEGKQGGPPAEAEQQPDKGRSQSPPTLRPRFAPEFDGIDCFETIVCR